MSLETNNYIPNYSPNNSHLLIPPFALEEEAIANGLGGSRYDDQLQEVVPRNPSLVIKTFNCVKKYFAEKIGRIDSTGNYLSFNSARNHKQLRKDGEIAAPKFIQGIRRISKQAGGKAVFEPKELLGLKSEGSLKRKIINRARKERISTEEAAQTISDSLRGAVLIDSEEQIERIAKKINRWIRREGGQVVWVNMFQEQRDDGYVGVNGKIVLPFITDKGEKKRIRCELLLHFKSFVDDSLHLPKFKRDFFYKDLNEIDPPPSSLLSEGISKLFLLSRIGSIGNICRIPEYLSSLCPKIPVLSNNLCENIQSASICEGNLGIPRHEMPQVSGGVKRDFLNEKERQGIPVEKRLIPAAHLTPVQNELSKTKVEKWIHFFQTGSSNPCSKAILISSQNRNGKKYVIDGHHRYAACRLIGGNQKVIAIGEDIRALLLELETFPGVRKSGLEHLED